MIILGMVMVVIFSILITYAVRHYGFYWNRMFGKQKRPMQDLAGYYLPSVSIVVPMHNEEAVAGNILERLAVMDYAKENGHYEVIAIDDGSTDKTGEIVDEYAGRYPFIRAIHRAGGGYGKADALQVGSMEARNEILLVFDADYQPSRACIKRLVAPFCDPEIGLVMGRVVPINTEQSLMTRLLDLERTGGYQVAQQAKHNLDLASQYGGTVGGIRKDLLQTLGGWDPRKLAEDTDITVRAFYNGWRIGYVNIAECYEESVTSWKERRLQLARWATGHNQCLLSHLGAVIKSPVLSFLQKFDGILMLGVYLVPVIMLIGLFLSITVYFFAAFWWWTFFAALLFTLTYNNIGNFACFNEVGVGAVLDKRGRVIWLLPWSLFNFFANVWICTGSFVKSLVIHGNHRAWDAGVTNGHANGNGVNWNKTKKNGSTNGNGNGIKWEKTKKNGLTNGNGNHKGKA